MKKLSWAFAAALICGLNVFSSCVNDNNDNPVIDNLAEKLIGKWMISDIEGQPALTNWKEVITFVSPTKAYVSKSIARREDMDSEDRPPKPEDMPDVMPEDIPGWNAHVECDVTIEGNTVILTSEGPNGSKMSTKYEIKSISASKFTCEAIREAPDGGPGMPPEGDGDKEKNIKQKQRYERVTVDYKQDILGKWEGHITSDMGSEFDDGEDHQWEYKADGTFVYYIQDEDGNWIVNPNQTESDYFVDGSLLCTRWVIDDEVGEDEINKDNREWWEIESIEGGVMKWKALRAREDGTTYVATFAMLRVKED